MSETCQRLCKGPFSNSGFETGARQIDRSSFENARFAKSGLKGSFEIGQAVPHLPVFEIGAVTSRHPTLWQFLLPRRIALCPPPALFWYLLLSHWDTHTDGCR